MSCQSSQPAKKATGIKTQPSRAVDIQAAQK